MAVANALGSNVFNVLVGLGLPYFIVQAARGRPAVVSPHPAFRQSDGSQAVTATKEGSCSCCPAGNSRIAGARRHEHQHRAPLLRLLQVSTAALWPDVGCLLVGLAAFLLLVAAARLRLSRAVGWALLAAYAGYLAYEVLTAWVWDVYGSQGR